jgi:hypothetical protein
MNIAKFAKYPYWMIDHDLSNITKLEREKEKC